MSKSALSFDVYRSYDPDLWACNEPAAMGTYAVERDESALTMPADVKPTKFRCRVLTRDQRRLVDESGSANGKRMLAFRYGLVEVADVAQDDGTYTTFTPSRSAAKDPLAPPVLEALEELGFGDRDMWDIGAAIMARSFLARGLRPYCELPVSSQAICAQMLSLRVERLKEAPMAKVESSPLAPTRSEADSPAAETPQP